jgi:hypothetical protein
MGITIQKPQSIAEFPFDNYTAFECNMPVVRGLGL